MTYYIISILILFITFIITTSSSESPPSPHNNHHNVNNHNDNNNHANHNDHSQYIHSHYNKPLHILVSTECTSYHDWQMEALLYSIFLVKQKGNITRVNMHIYVCV